MADENSSNSVDQSVIVIRSVEEAGNSNATVNGLGSSKESVGERKVTDLKDDDKHSCVIDVKSGGGGDGGGNGKLGENLDGERICRICHLSSDPETPPRPPTTTNVTVMMANTGLIELGCDCKDELGIVHTYCAEAWFKLKGNRQCEICGETAKNITGVGDTRFMEEWNETRTASNGTNTSNRRGGCWRGQPFCNFLMACLVIAFVLPWFFRVNMF
ncbi:hypothetical protein LOK49_LG09G02126 [Camellia lanceoleosa]|uniref:Uncharacterized protein n=1 Tax=Camellia lanceoleosa TaxID=1840588 RepID=A0ACC0GFG9_9ERIC|nr:hypothetical protein LOK49_LG09G02126 [Camellia lanceoleosa]